MTPRDTLLEARLHDALADLRPTAGAPQSLRARVAGLATRERSKRARWLRVGGAVAVVAVGGVAIALLAGQSIRLTPPDGVGGAPPPTFNANVEGPGIVTGVASTLTIAAWSAVGLAAVLLWFGARRRARRSIRSALVIATAILLVAVATAVAVQPGPATGGFNGYGPVIGLRLAGSVEDPGTTGHEHYVLEETVAPGEPFIFFFVVQNTGWLPIRLEGLLEEADAESLLVPRWTALALGTDPNAFGQPPDQLVPFRPVDLAPDAYVTVYVVGKASRCAAGSGSNGGAFVVRGPAMQFAYSVFGLQSVATYTMPILIQEPYLEHCA